MADAKQPSKKTSSKKDTSAAKNISSEAAAELAFADAVKPGLAAIRVPLCNLRNDPPQSLIFEGGIEAERTSLALWYAAMLNCPNVSVNGPCLADTCRDCVQSGNLFHPNISVLDGREGHISINAVREVRDQIGNPPHGNGRRVVLLTEAQSLGTEAANALLKVMEDPRPNVHFLLLAPHRKRLLPTLVSRGWVLTLPWPPPGSAYSSVSEWVDALTGFCTDGRGWFTKTSVKNSIDAPTVLRLIAAVQIALAAVIRGETNASPLAAVLSKLPPAGLNYAADVLTQCRQSIDVNVNPALAADWMAVKLYTAVRHAVSRR